MVWIQTRSWQTSFTVWWRFQTVHLLLILIDVDGAWLSVTREECWYNLVGRSTQREHWTWGWLHRQLWKHGDAGKRYKQFIMKKRRFFQFSKYPRHGEGHGEWAVKLQWQLICLGALEWWTECFGEVLFLIVPCGYCFMICHFYTCQRRWANCWGLT